MVPIYSHWDLWSHLAPCLAATSRSLGPGRYVTARVFPLFSRSSKCNSPSRSRAVVDLETRNSSWYSPKCSRPRLRTREMAVCWRRFSSMPWPDSSARMRSARAGSRTEVRSGGGPGGSPAGQIRPWVSPAFLFPTRYCDQGGPRPSKSFGQFWEFRVFRPFVSIRQFF